MKQKTEAEMELARAIKIRRTLTRLKWSLKADEELNQTLPALAAEFNDALQSGELLTLELPDGLDVTD